MKILVVTWRVNGVLCAAVKFGDHYRMGSLDNKTIVVSTDFMEEILREGSLIDQRVKLISPEVIAKIKK